MNMIKCEIFLKVIEFGSLTKAAEYLGYTQPAISQTIKSLENDLGVTLLLRSRSGLTLTTEGEALLPDIKNLIKMKNKLSDHIDHLHNLHQGHLRIGAFHSVAANILPPLIRNFQTLYPKIEFEFVEGGITEIEQALGTGHIDLGVLSIRDFDNFETIPLRKDPLYLVLPPDHPMENVNPFPVKSLDKDPYIGLDPHDCIDSQIIWDSLGIQPYLKYRCKEDNTILSMVENGLGFSILPETALHHTHYNVTILETEPAYFRILGIALRSKKDATYAAKAFIKYLRQNLQDENLTQDDLEEFN